jgi:mono/diheme cytochrome c family protein
MSRTAIGVAASLLLLASPSLADQSGGGGQRPPVPKTGEEVYVMVCQGCHMRGGVGAEGAAKYPALANNPRMGTSAYVISIVEKGRGGMPGFYRMSPQQVAAVVNYLRTHFGNSYPQPVTADDVRPFAKPGPPGE